MELRSRVIKKKITVVREWGDHIEAHMDHAWLMMLSHVHGETRLHSGELRVPVAAATASHMLEIPHVVTHSSPCNP